MKTFLRKFIRISATIFVVALFAIASSASAEEISSFTADIEINPDSSISITEEIQYDFEKASRHGIFRDIPVSYQTDAGNRRIFIDVAEVLQDGESAQINESREGDNFRIRIGDPDETITGAHTYEITYHVRGALNFFEDDGTAELYWDIVGDEWEVPIRSASANVFLVEGQSADTEDITTRCFVGAAGSGASCGNLSEIADPLGLTASTRNIQPGEAMTTVLSFPDKLVEEPGALTSWWWWLQANPLVPLPLAAFFIGFFVWYRWGKDPEGRGVVVTQYEPPQDLKPILVGSLIDETVHMRDITAGIIYLAEQGFIEIERLEKRSFIDSHDYRLRQMRSLSEINDPVYEELATVIFAHADKEKNELFGASFRHGAKRFAISFRQGLFALTGLAFFDLIVVDTFTNLQVPFLFMILISFAVGGISYYRQGEKHSDKSSKEDEQKKGETDQQSTVLLSTLRKEREFQQAIKGAKEYIKKDMRARGWFAEENNKASLSLVGMIILTMVMLFFLGSSLTGISVLGGIVAIVIALIFLALMKKKTKKGAVLQENLEGFKLFLSMTQKERLDFHNAPERKPKEFMQYLPYAIALGVEDKWAEQFAGLEMTEPDWYHGTGAFAATDFASDMSTFSKSYSQAASGASGASGGSAGGGMGGGGGGSW